jgi:hypothetical protein
VVVTDAGIDYWIFSTIWTSGDGYHPVSGNSWFGVSLGEDGNYIFATSGADRVTTWVDDAFSGTVFAGADSLWRSLQQGITNFIITNGGDAVVGDPFSQRYQWDGADGVQAQYFHPTGEWLDI